MSAQSTSELRELGFDDLTRRLADAKAELFNLRFQLATNQLENTAQLRTTRREIARISTLLREQELAEWHASQGDRKSDRKRS